MHAIDHESPGAPALVLHAKPRAHPRPSPIAAVLTVSSAPPAQIEGATTVGGRTPSIWDTFVKVPGKILNASNADIAVDHYNRRAAPPSRIITPHALRVTPGAARAETSEAPLPRVTRRRLHPWAHRWKQDVALMKSLGIKHYRMSFSWTRLVPNGEVGKWNPVGVQFYNNLINELVNNNITVYGTLYHWDLPQRLQVGGCPVTAWRCLGWSSSERSRAEPRAPAHRPASDATPPARAITHAGRLWRLHVRAPRQRLQVSFAACARPLLGWAGPGGGAARDPAARRPPAPRRPPENRLPFVPPAGSLPTWRSRHLATGSRPGSPSMSRS
jgi:hypothetical protein